MTTLGKYELHEVLGKGGFGTVYRATDMALDREVALKVLHPAMLVDTGFIQRFRQEARSAAKLDHPHIVPVYDLGESNGQIYLAMKFLPGGSLKDTISREGAMNFERALSVLRQLTSALDYAHGKGLIHRDIKPGNILWEDENNVRLSDFGFAKAMTADTSSSYSISGGMVGTPAYMAPEIWRRKTISPATDVYSLGCVFYEILNGECLFTGDSPADIMTSHVLDGPNFSKSWPEGTPPGVTEVLTRALANKPEERFPSCGAFAAAIETIKQADREQIMGDLSSVGQAETQGREQTPIKAEAKQVAAEERTQHEAESTLQVLQECEQARIEVETLTTRNAEEQDHREGKTQPPEQTVPMIQSDTTVADQVGGRKKIPVWWGWLVGVAVLLVLLFFAVRGIVWATLAEQEPTQVPIVVPTPAPITEPTSAPAAGVSVPPACTEKGQLWVSPADGMTLMCVPAGKFTMGSNDGEDDEKPVHEVYLDTYWMDQTEVTNAQYARCVAAGGCTVPVNNSSDTHARYFGYTSYNNFPVIYVDWNKAAAYCAWAGRSLPTEAQWEKAARGTDRRVYPWGSATPTCGLANFLLGGRYCVGDTTVEGSHLDGASPYGVLDMAGNVWEWTADWYGPYSSGEQSNPVGPVSGKNRVLRGASWRDGPEYVRSTYRNKLVPSYDNDSLGFRCALALP